MLRGKRVNIPLPSSDCLFAKQVFDFCASGLRFSLFCAFIVFLFLALNFIFFLWFGFSFIHWSFWARVRECRACVCVFACSSRTLVSPSPSPRSLFALIFNCICAVSSVTWQSVRVVVIVCTFVCQIHFPCYVAITWAHSALRHDNAANYWLQQQQQQQATDRNNKSSSSKSLLPICFELDIRLFAHLNGLSWRGWRSALSLFIYM